MYILILLYRVCFRFAIAAESVPQRPSTHAEADDESASSRHWYQSHRHVLRGWHGGRCDFRGQRRTLHFVHVDVLFRHSADCKGIDVFLIFFRFRPLQLQFRDFRMILFGR